MSARGLHQITGSVFEHRHIECGACVFRQPSNNPEFPEKCGAKGRLLCCPRRHWRDCTRFVHAIEGAEP